MRVEKSLWDDSLNKNFLQATTQELTLSACQSSVKSYRLEKIARKSRTAQGNDDQTTPKHLSPKLAVSCPRLI